MTKDDFDNFARIWTRAYRSASRGKDSAPEQTSFAFDVLSIYSLGQIANALVDHARSPDDKFGLIPQDIVRHIDGKTPDADDIIAAARLKKTAIGVLAAIQIGGYDLSGGDSFLLRVRAKECLQLLPEWRDRIARNALSQHERERMAHYGVDPSQASLYVIPATQALPHQMKSITSDGEAA